MNGDQYYKEAMKNSSKKAQYKVANLMKHGYEMHPSEIAIRLSKDDTNLIILPNGEVYMRCIY